jgi:hypothetical protein
MVQAGHRQYQRRGAERMQGQLPPRAWLCPKGLPGRSFETPVNRENSTKRAEVSEHML